MNDYFTSLPENIREHIQKITKTSGLPDTDESVEKMAEVWMEKEKVFEEKTETMGLEEVDVLEADDPRAALLMTYSGSLISVGTLKDDQRRVEYTSIGLRGDVPNTLELEGNGLVNHVIIDEGVEFKTGPIQKTSPIYKIIICKEENLEADEQEEKIKNAATVIMDDFVEVNKTLILDDEYAA